MKRLEAIHTLRHWDKQGRFVFTLRDMCKLFHNDSPKTLLAGLNRLVKDKLLIRAFRGIYVNPSATSFDGYTIEHIAIALRPGEYNYVSLESILSEYGVISQIPMDRITVMTTGRSGLIKTAYGIIEFTHTKRSKVEVTHSIIRVPRRPLRIATKAAAWRDLKRVGRNIDMVDLEMLLDDTV